MSIIGTVHVDPDSAARVRETILASRPEVVALELDEARMIALLNPKAQRGRGAGISFLTMALLERFAGQLAGSAPGTEMLEAARAARQVGSRIEFIDLPIVNTALALKRLPRREKAKLVIDSLASLVVLPFGKINWSEITEDLETQIEGFRKRYPTLSRLLIDSREEYMIYRLKHILESTNGHVLAVVGFGHRASLARAFADYMEAPGHASGAA
ncbi:MAG TPA: TraB/GumN family protein [Candidatus Bathyarchaeia archaeon]|nr:TraB/GumN family protein [Candidatus Bathyarchaeia archaeon]